MVVENEWRPQQKVCYEAGDENSGLDLEELRERGRSAISLLSCLVRVALWVPRECLLEFRNGIKQQVGEGI